MRVIGSPLGSLFCVIIMTIMAPISVVDAAETLEKTVRIRPAEWAQEIINSDLGNWYKVDKILFRSKQPQTTHTADIKSLGIQRVLSLREYHSDENLIEDSSISLHRIKVRTRKMSQQQLVEALKIILSEPTPILVHCLHGSDRTGAVIASYRVLVQGWSKQAALDELKNGDYGFHKTFDNIPELVLNMDVPAMKKELALPQTENPIPAPQ